MKRKPVEIRVISSAWGSANVNTTRVTRADSYEEALLQACGTARRSVDVDRYSDHWLGDRYRWVRLREVIG